jgi:hypothetical protein
VHWVESSENELMLNNCSKIDMGKESFYHTWCWAHLGKYSISFIANQDYSVESTLDALHHDQWLAVT